MALETKLMDRTKLMETKITFAYSLILKISYKC